MGTLVFGFTFSSRLNRRISSKSIKRFKTRIRDITRRVRGRRIEVIVKEKIVRQ